jgi:hypothetical protein
MRATQVMQESFAEAQAINARLAKAEICHLGGPHLRAMTDEEE